jgi:hypothetical protein
MEVLLRITSSVDDVLDLILGEEFSTPAEQTMKQYPYLFLV